MQGAKAEMREKAQNVSAKVEEKLKSAQASATEKTEKVMANDKAGEQEAKARKHEKEADALLESEQKKVENHAEKLRAKQEAHHGAMQNSSKPNATNNTNVAGTGGATEFPLTENPYVQPPEGTSPTTVSHPHLIHEKITGNEGFPQDQPHQGTKVALPQGQQLPTPTNLTNPTGFGASEQHQAHPEAYPSNSSQTQSNTGFPQDQPGQGAKATFSQKQ